MNCKYCNQTIQTEPIQVYNQNNKSIITIPTCISKKCIAQFSFDSCKDLMEISSKEIRKFLLELAKSASTAPDRYDPLPIGYLPEHLNEGASNQFMNYLQLSLGNVNLVEDDFFVDEKTGFKSYTFDYSNDPWDNFTYLFHGSPFHNWHSIIRNGLKNYSGTNKMTTGAVWGPGIYFSDDLSVSFEYAGGRSGHGKYAIGVFEVKKPTETQIAGMQQYIPKSSIKLSENAIQFDDSIRQYYRRSHSIFVVPYEENVRIKYLVIIPNMENLQSFSSMLIKSFIDRLRSKQSAQPRMNALSLKRIMRERKSINELIPEIEIKEFAENCITHWNCVYHDGLIEKENNHKRFEFDVRFPFNYPIVPPDIIVKGFENHPNIYENHVCMDVLYNWKLNNKLEYVLLTFVHEILLKGTKTITKINEQKSNGQSKNLPNGNDSMLKEFFDKKMTEMSKQIESVIISNPLPDNMNTSTSLLSASWCSIKNSLELIRYFENNKA